MAISRIQAASAQATNVAISAPAVGDLILSFAHRDGSTTAPSLAAGYTNIANSGANTNSARLAYKFSDGTETTGGTWTNATSVAVGVYRGCHPQMPAGDAQPGGAASGTLSFTALTMQNADSTSWVVGFAGSRTATDVGTNAPSGMATRSSATDVAIFDTGGGASSWSTQTASINASLGWRTYTVELCADANVLVDQIVGHTMSQTNGNGESGNAFKCPTPNPTLAGNCLVLCISYAFSAGRTVSVTDDKGSSWPAASVTRNNNAGDLTAKLFVLPSVAAGITTITVTFDAALQGFLYNITELWGIAASTPVDVSTSAQPNTPTVAAGSITTTQANDLIFTWGTMGGWGVNYVGALPSGFRAMVGHRLLSCDMSVSDSGYGLGCFAMIGTQASIGGVNPTCYMKTAATESINTLAVALKTDMTQGSQASGIRVVGIQKTRMQNGTAIPKAFPCWGNLQLLVSSETNSQSTVTAIKDNVNGSWTLITTSGPQIFYIANARGSSSNYVSVTSSASNFLHGVFYDIVGAAIAPYDTSIDASGGSVTGPANISDAPDITPTTYNGLILASLNLFTGPPDTASLPSGLTYDCAYYTGMTDLSTMDTGDGYAHYYNGASLAQAAFRWHLTAVTTSAWSARAAAFKAAMSIKSLFVKQAVNRASTY